MLTCQKLRISAECWTSIGSSCHFFISFVVHIVSTCQTSARPELDFRDWTRETSETRDFQACCGRVMRMRRVISLSFDTCKDAHILKRFSKSFRHIGAFWNFPSARGSEADQFSQLRETTTHTSTIQIRSEYLHSPIERCLMMVTFATTTNYLHLQHFSAHLFQTADAPGAYARINPAFAKV